MEENMKLLLDKHADTIARYKVLDAQIKELKKEFIPLKEELLKVPEFVKEGARRGTDLKTLEAVYPEIYELLQKITKTRTLKV